MDALGRSVLAAVRADGLIAHGEVVVVACSGGPDSLVLLDVLAGLRRVLGCTLHAVYVDHGLRPAAAREGKRVLAEAAARDLTAEVVRIAVARGGNLMARARDGRYAALEAARLRVGAAAIALAHTASDQAETVLMRLCDGAGSPGLAAMAPRRGALVRPLLGVTRAEVLAYVRARGLRPVKDPSNRDPQYRRVRIRERILPTLRAVEPDADRALARAADNLRDDAAVLAWAACHALEVAGFSPARCELDLTAWAHLPAAVRARALAAAVGQAGGRTPSRREVRALLALCDGTDGSASLDVGGLTVRRSYGRLALGAPVPATPPGPQRLSRSGTVRFGGREITFELAPGVEVDLRAPAAGDRVALAGGGHKKLARLFIDLKLPRAMRSNQPVLARPDSREVIAVPGLLPAAGSTGVRVKACVDSPLTHKTGVQ